MLHLKSYYNQREEDIAKSPPSNPWNLESGEIFRASTFGQNMRLKRTSKLHLLEAMQNRSFYQLLRTLGVSTALTKNTSMFDSIVAPFKASATWLGDAFNGLFSENIRRVNLDDGLKNEFNPVASYLSETFKSVKNGLRSSWKAVYQSTGKIMTSCEHKIDSFLLDKFDQAVGAKSQMMNGDHRSVLKSHLDVNNEPLSYKPRSLEYAHNGPALIPA